jgi:hypothetical protein
MSSYPPPGQGAPGPGASRPGHGPGSIGQRIDEAIEIIEMELRHAAAYVNDAVIPQVRSESISALRNVGNALRNFADKLDRQQQPPNPPPGQAPRDRAPDQASNQVPRDREKDPRP